jgi:hypothetical protein
MPSRGHQSVGGEIRSQYSASRRVLSSSATVTLVRTSTVVVLVAFICLHAGALLIVLAEHLPAKIDKDFVDVGCTSVSPDAAIAWP